MEDYWFFNIDVMMNCVCYDNVLVGSCMCCIIMQNSSWYGFVGGVVWVGFWCLVGSLNVSVMILCWVFLNLFLLNLCYVVEVVLYEVGYMLGFFYDGLKDVLGNVVVVYYFGYGIGNISWVLIMGLGYYSNVV